MPESLTFHDIKAKLLLPIPARYTIIKPPALNLSTLAGLFESATRLPVERYPDRIEQAGFRVPIAVRVDEGQELVVFSAEIEFRSGVSSEMMSMLADGMNANGYLVRCSVRDERILQFDHTLVCDNGVLGQTILNSRIRFDYYLSIALGNEEEGPNLLSHDPNLR